MPAMTCTPIIQSVCPSSACSITVFEVATRNRGRYVSTPPLVRVSEAPPCFRFYSRSQSQPLQSPRASVSGQQSPCLLFFGSARAVPSSSPTAGSSLKSKILHGNIMRRSTALEQLTFWSVSPRAVFAFRFTSGHVTDFKVRQKKKKKCLGELKRKCVS